MVLFKKFKVILIFLFKRNLFSNFFVTSCNLHKINKYLPFNLFFLNYRKCPKIMRIVTLNPYILSNKKIIIKKK